MKLTHILFFVQASLLAISAMNRTNVTTTDLDLEEMADDVIGTFNTICGTLRYLPEDQSSVQWRPKWVYENEKEWCSEYLRKNTNRFLGCSKTHSFFRESKRIQTTIMKTLSPFMTAASVGNGIKTDINEMWKWLRRKLSEVHKRGTRKLKNQLTKARARPARELRRNKRNNLKTSGTYVEDEELTKRADRVIRAFKDFRKLFNNLSDFCKTEFRDRKLDAAIKGFLDYKNALPDRYCATVKRERMRIKSIVQKYQLNTVTTRTLFGWKQPEQDIKDYLKAKNHGWLLDPEESYAKTLERHTARAAARNPKNLNTRIRKRYKHVRSIQNKPSHRRRNRKHRRWGNDI